MIEKIISNLEEEIKKRDIPIWFLRKILKEVQKFDIKPNK